MNIQLDIVNTIRKQLKTAFINQFSQKEIH